MYGLTFEQRQQILATWIPNGESAPDHPGRAFVILFSVLPDEYGLNGVQVSTVGTGYDAVEVTEWTTNSEGPDVWRTTPDPVEFPEVTQEYTAVGWGVAWISEGDVTLIAFGPLRVAEDGLALPVQFPAGDVPRIVDLRVMLR